MREALPITLLLAGAILFGIAPAQVRPAAAISVPDPPQPTDLQLLDTVQHRAFAFFWNESHPETGLTKDRARSLGDEPDTYTVASIASTGYALASLPVAVERNWLPREDAYQRALTTLRFIHDRLPNVHGFYYHFVDWRTGERVWKCELSSIDTALLVLGGLAAGQYWRGTEVERLANAIYARVDFPWVQRGDGADAKLKTLSHGWKPETGWLKGRWARYDEASFLYLLAMGSPTRALGLAHASLRALWERHRNRIWGRYGFSNAFNVDKDWYDKDVIGIDLGMMLLGIENHRTGLIWRLMRSHPSMKRGMAAAGMRRQESGSP